MPHRVTSEEGLRPSYGFAIELGCQAARWHGGQPTTTA